MNTRILKISRETRAINAAGGFGGAIEAMPKWCITLGMKEILSSKKSASKETADKVWRIVKELGYMPNQNARNLILKNEKSEIKTNTKAIGCIFTSTKDTYNDPFFPRIALGIQDEISKRGYVMCYSFSSCDMSFSALYNNLAVNPVDGAIILGRFSNDVVAIGAMKAISEKGLKIPDDIAVVGLDDIELSAYVTPSLTTIHIPKVELGRFAVKMLIDRIGNGHTLPVRMDIPFELIIRESCGEIKNI